VPHELVQPRRPLSAEPDEANLESIAWRRATQNSRRRHLHKAPPADHQMPDYVNAQQAASNL
jgi:hypothetical protein